MKEQADKGPPSDLQGQKRKKKPCAAYRNVLHKVLNRQLFFVCNNLGAHPDVVARFFRKASRLTLPGCNRYFCTPLFGAFFVIALWAFLSKTIQ